MSTTRRRFLVGATGLITAAFVSQARAFARSKGTALLIPPPRTDRVLHATEADGTYTLSFGPNEVIAPDPPTWRSYFAQRGEPLGEALRLHGLDASAADNVMDPIVWETAWEETLSPAAQAYGYLDRLPLGARKGDLGSRAGALTFLDAPNPMSAARWVEADDLVTLSLLQARLAELREPVRLLVE